MATALVQSNHRHVFVGCRVNMLPDGTGTIPSPFKIDTYTVRGVLLSLRESVSNSREQEGSSASWEMDRGIC
jgi:hypothetical protein